MSKKMKQHYVPKFYLKNFLPVENDPKRTPSLYVYQMGNIFRKSPENTGFKNYYYNVKIEGKEPSVIEDLLSVIESDAKPVISRTLSLGLSFLNEDDRYHLTRFISFLFTRTPRMRELLRVKWANFTKHGLDIHMQNNSVDKSIFKDSGAYLEFLNRKLDFNPELLIATSISAAIGQLTAFGDRNLILLYSHSKKFITSDNPVVLHNRKINCLDWLPGLGLPDTDFYLPLSSQVCLLGTYLYSDSLTQKITDYKVQFINDLICKHKNEYLFGSDDVYFKTLQ